MEFRELVQHALKEQWKQVNQEIPKVASDSKYIKWAMTKGIQDSHPNVRDLALSILEMAELTPKELKSLEKFLFIMMRKDPMNSVRYRAAFVLSSHDVKTNSEEIMNMLRTAMRDPDFKERAEAYLDSFNE